MSNFIKKFVKDEDGATMVEYGLMVVGIAVVVGVAAAALGGRVVALFNGVDVTP